MLSDPGTDSTSSGFDNPNSITEAAVTILFTEPGSNGEETDGFPSCLSSWRPMSWDGSNVLSLAIASTSPVFASSTTAATLCAPALFFASSTCCWT